MRSQCLRVAPKPVIYLYKPHTLSLSRSSLCIALGAMDGGKGKGNAARGVQGKAKEGGGLSPPAGPGKGKDNPARGLPEVLPEAFARSQWLPERPF